MAELTTRLDQASPAVFYLGKASVGANEDDLVWQLKKIETSGTVMKITMPNGVNNFNSSWTSRASYSYS